MTRGPADERPHPPGESSWWWETWHLDAATEEGVGVAVRLACAPALGVAWWWTHVLLPDLPGPIVVRDHEVGLPRQGLEVRADGLWGELWCASPFERWTYGLEAFGVRLDDPADSLHGEIGDRMPVGLDIEWEADTPGGAAHEYVLDHRMHGYEQFGTVHGEVLLDRTRLELDAVGLRSHTWGIPRIDRPACSLWLHSADRSVSFTVSGGVDVDGYVVHPGAAEAPITSVRTETGLRADGLPVTARHIIDDELVLEVEVRGLSAVPLSGPAGERATLARGLCAYGERSPGIGAAEIGWSSWLVPG